MIDEIVAGLLNRHPFELLANDMLIKVELKELCGEDGLSLLTSERGKPVGYLDFSHSRNLDYARIESERGYLASSGYVVDSRFSYYPDVIDGFKGYSPSWGFFINEQYRGKGIGSLMFSLTLAIAKELSQPRPLTQQEIDEVDWDYIGAPPPRLDEQRACLKPNEAFFMVYRMMSGFFGAYFRDGSRSLKPGVEFCEAYSDVSSALVFPDFQIPPLSGVRQLKQLEVNHASPQ